MPTEIGVTEEKTQRKNENTGEEGERTEKKSDQKERNEIEIEKKD
jgi:hypothetical protein